MRTIKTIGVHGFNEEAFLRKLRDEGVTQLIDLRQRRGMRGPAYAWANSGRLQDALAAAGIDYVHRRDLSPTPQIREVQHEEDHRRGVSARTRTEMAPEYARRFKEEVLDRSDLDSLVAQLPEDGSAALLCVEENPAMCHRSLVAGRLTERDGLDVKHLAP